ncbi:hypothetical protein Vau01_064380 [Virgisporangium aurantiacum]|uniref:Uncharacterized protein n=1 Tax=Virgisporangium aurantiacum TaxID=175570 RepID=A0A8J3Z8C4_9ACTN|nr:hypothetical protein Vau01_064380 [Virgisporangium aurantiacum]
MTTATASPLFGSTDTAHRRSDEICQFSSGVTQRAIRTYLRALHALGYDVDPHPAPLVLLLRFVPSEAFASLPGDHSKLAQSIPAHVADLLFHAGDVPAGPTVATLVRCRSLARSLAIPVGI